MGRLYGEFFDGIDVMVYLAERQFLVRVVALPTSGESATFRSAECVKP
jgi:hypothetical protein